MKKRLFTILALLFFSLSSPLLSFASDAGAIPVQYNKQVNISLPIGNTVNLAITGSYQLVNKDTNAVTVLPTSVGLAFSKATNGITVQYNDVNQTSVAGFTVVELASAGTSIGKVNNGTSYRGSFEVKLNANQLQLINYLDIENYLKGVVPNEMPASWAKEALKAQAITARSYAAHGLLLSTTATSQVYKGYSSEDARTNQAIDETAGIYIKHNGKPVQTFFHSTSGGRTANVGDVWNSDQKYFPYLTSVDDQYEESRFSNWSVTYTPAEILQSFGVSSSAVIYDMVLQKTGANGEVSGVTLKTSLGDVTKTGNESQIRGLFPLSSSLYYNKLYSNWFDVELTKTETEKVTVQTTNGQALLDSLAGQTVQTASGQISLSDNQVTVQTSTGTVEVGTGKGFVSVITLNGKGWGHRIGMSQYGAKGYAEHGWTAEQILTHYFQGTTISK